MDNIEANTFGAKRIYVVLYQDDGEYVTEVNCMCFTRERALQEVRRLNLCLKNDGYDWFTDEGDLKDDRPDDACYYYYDSGLLKI